MKLKMKQVIDPEFFRVDKKLANMKVKVCGARKPDDSRIRCDEPEWLGDHTWHTADYGWEQWCGCGEDHHYAKPCDGVLRAIQGDNK